MSQSLSDVGAERRRRRHVQDGIDTLDEMWEIVRPHVKSGFDDWRDCVNWDALDMEQIFCGPDEQGCVLTQLFGDYKSGLDALHLDYEGGNYRGFDVCQAGETYGQLTEMWKELR